MVFFFPPLGFARERRRSMDTCRGITMMIITADGDDDGDGDDEDESLRKFGDR